MIPEVKSLYVAAAAAVAVVVAAAAAVVVAAVAAVVVVAAAAAGLAPVQRQFFAFGLFFQLAQQQLERDSGGCHRRYRLLSKLQRVLSWSRCGHPNLNCCLVTSTFDRQRK